MERGRRAVPEGRPIAFRDMPLEYPSVMSHTYCCALLHCVFATKGRRRTISPEMQPRLWAYMGGMLDNME